MNSEDSSHRFFWVERSLLWGYCWDCVARAIEGQQRVGFDRAIG
ncbi:hypothetical protein QUA70_10900 [Microcoleus sp. LAD1_D5]